MAGKRKLGNRQFWDARAYELRLQALSFQEISDNAWAHAETGLPIDKADPNAIKVFKDKTRSWEAFRREEAARLMQSQDLRESSIARLDDVVSRLYPDLSSTDARIRHSAAKTI